MASVIKIENLSKQYRLGLVGTGTLSHDLRRWWHLVRGKEDPYLKIGEVNDRSIKGTSDYVWALKDINIEVQQGEVLGIIGKNGAGKSTLLKILSKVTAPSTGSITYKGRIGSLLEVGTGFHSELTGRENVFLNGSILGMRKKEIDRKFDEIVDFSGCERYIDTPVKRYSSGMTVRLGFAVAAFLEPEILVVDEVLAVGDAEFQKKAIGKMQEVSKNDGRTVLFVSHNMESIQRLCNKCILLESGSIIKNDNTDSVISYYIEKNYGSKPEKYWEKVENFLDAIPISIKTHDEFYRIKDSFLIEEKVGISFEYEILDSKCKIIPGLKFYNKGGINIFDTHDTESFLNSSKPEGHYISTVWIPGNFFNEGIVIICSALLQPNPFKVFFFENESIAFNILDKGNSTTRGEYAGIFPGAIRPLLNWDTSLIE